MYRIPRRHRTWVILFALWLAFEPLAVAIVRAEEPNSPTLNGNKVEGIEAIKDAMTPAEYLEYLLELRGNNKEDVEAKAWGDWLTTLSGVYMMMDAGAQDVFSFYSTMKSVADGKDAPNVIPQVMKDIGKYAVMTVGFLGRSWALVFNLRGLNAFEGFARNFQRMEKFAANSRTFRFLEFMAPPPYWSPKGLSLWKISAAEAKSAAGFKSYWRWCKAKTVGGDGKFVMSDLKGAARSVGVGLAIFSLAIEGYGIVKSEDRQTGRFSYSLAKNIIGATLAAATLIAMFCVPIVGQIVAIAALLWMAVSAVGDILGDYQKRWKEAYKNSYWFLYQNDTEFKSFYDNRSALKPEEKAASYILAERHYGFVRDQQPAAGEEEIYKRSKAVLEALEKQGVVMTYYNQTGFTLPDFDINRLQELWRKKADYMSWKPTEPEAEAAKKRGFWGTVGHVINPMTYVRWAGDKAQSRGYASEIKNQDIKRVFFNPDYVLVKKFKNFMMARNLKGGIYDVVGIRMEQSPYNYIPMVGIDSVQWNEEFLMQAFRADSFIVGSKEMIYFGKQLELLNGTLEDRLKGFNDAVAHMSEKDLPQSTKDREALQLLVEKFQLAPDEANEALFKKCQEAFGWRWNSTYGDKTPRKILQCYQADIEQVLAYSPLSIAQKAADTVLLLLSIKNAKDTTKLMYAMGEEKKEALSDAEFTKDFPSDTYRKFLKEGTFLDIKGGGLMNWLGEIYPAYEELRKHTELYMKQVRKYAEFADTSDSTERDGFLWMGKTVQHPKAILQGFNDELTAYKTVLEKYEEIKDELNLNLPISRSEDQKLHDGIFKDGGYQPVCDTAALDLNTPVLPPMNPE